MIRFCTTKTEFQTACNVCLAGDVIKLDHTKTFLGSVLVPDRGVIPANNPIIIEGDGDPNLLPAPGYRITPAHSAQLPKLKGTRADFALRFLAASNGFIVRNVEFLPNDFTGIGHASAGTNDSTQTEYSQQPYNILFDRCLARGDIVGGHKRGISLHGKNLRVENCWIDRIGGVGQDTCPVDMNNGEGPYTVLNCFLDSGAYGTMTGASDVLIRTITTVLASPAPTPTTFRLASIKDLRIGQLIAYEWDDAGVIRQAHRYVTAINTTTNDVTFGTIDAIQSPGDALGATARVPGEVRFGVNANNITIRRNHFYRDPLKRSVFPAGPVLNSAVVSPAGTGLPAGNYFYRIQGAAIGKGYTGLDVYSPESNEKAVTVVSTSQVDLAWSPIPNITTYGVFRYQKDATGYAINGQYYRTTALTFTDINGVGTAFSGGSTNPSGSLNGADGTNWVIKNHIEFKFGTNVQVDSNIIENSWKGGDNGYAMWLKCNNQSGGQPFAQHREIMVEKNLWLNLEGFISISGVRSTSELPIDNGENIYNLTVRNNLGFKSGVSRCIDLTSGTFNLHFDHNTWIHTSHSNYFMAAPSTNKGSLRGFSCTNSLGIRNDYGVFGAGTEGKPTLDAACINEYDFDHNVIGGTDGSIAARYAIPGKTNFHPSLATFQNQFKLYGGTDPNNYRLKRISEGDAIDSIYLNAGLDGKDLGADVDLVLASIAGVREGLPENVAPPVEPPSSNVRTKMISVAAPAAIGTQQIDVGFAPKAVLFFYNHLGTDGELADYAIGKGAAFIDGTMTSGWAMSKGAVTPSDTAYGYWMDRCIGVTNNAAVITGSAVVSNWGPTGFTLDWAAVDSRRPVINCLVLGGIGLENGKAFTLTGRTTNGTQDIALGFEPTLVSIFTSVNSSTTPPPSAGSKSMSNFYGYASGPSNQWVIRNRVQNALNPAGATRGHLENMIIYSRNESGDQTKAALQTMLPTGFRLNYTVTNGFGDFYIGFALKGPRCLVHHFTEPVANGTQSYSTGFKPEAIILASGVLAPAGGNSNDARFVFGAASSISEKATIYSGMANATNPTNGRSRLDRTRLYAGFDNANPLGGLADADLTAISTTGYTLDWSGTPSGTEILAVVIGAATEGVPVELSAILDPDVDLQANLTTFGEMSAVMEAMDTDLQGSISIAQGFHHSIIAFFNLKVNLDVKREVDSGIVDAFAADVGGTQVNFNKAFKDIDSITLTVASLTPMTATYDFADVANPAGFKVFAHNPAGSRVNAPVSWKARGIV